MNQITAPPNSVIKAWALDPSSIEPLSGGLINLSFAASRDDGEQCVLQRLNALFPAEVNDDIEAITAHLAARGLTTPRIVRSVEDTSCVIEDGDVWRVMTRIHGETHQSLRQDSDAGEAGRILGAFHAAAADFNHELRSSRPFAQNLVKHLSDLGDALQAHGDHQAAEKAEHFATRIFALAEKLGSLPELPARLIHGDPKISNILFEQDRAVCLIDLDTIARRSVISDLGDAFRSWCNPAGEDNADASFSFDRFRIALDGYFESAGEFLSNEEIRAIPEGTLRIALGLAARFAADALRESYFGWDRERFDSASQHNLVRTESQVRVAEAVAAQLSDLNRLVVTQM